MVGVRICKKPRQEASFRKFAPFVSLLTVAVKRSAPRILQAESHSGRPSRHLHSNVRFWPKADLDSAPVACNMTDMLRLAGVVERSRSKSGEAERPQGDITYPPSMEKCTLENHAKKSFALVRGVNMASPSRTELTPPTLTARRILRMTGRERRAA